MKELSPREALKQYRLTSPVTQNEQAEMFTRMPASDRMELLFYMAIHLVNGMQYVHGLVDQVSAKTTDWRKFGESTEEN